VKIIFVLFVSKNDDVSTFSHIDAFISEICKVIPEFLYGF